MDIDSFYKKIKDESSFLIAREKELLRKLDDIKRLKHQNALKKAKIEKLEKEIADLLSLDEDG